MSDSGAAADRQLRALLAGFKARCELSYLELGKRASCSHGTAENYITKPGHRRGEEILRSLLTALGATDAERAEALRLHRLSSPATPDPGAVGWIAAAAAAECTVWECDQFTPSEATVHSAIRRDRLLAAEQNALLSPPAYVRRDHDTSLRADIAASARGELRALIVLRGGPSTGKTRSLFEAVHALGPGWAVIRPRSAAALRGLATSGLLRRRRCVLWLNELQTFLGPNEAGLSLDVLRDLFDVTRDPDTGKPEHRHSLVVVATLWPEKLREATAAADSLSDNRDLLLSANHWVRWHDVPRDFSRRERDTARTLAASTSDDRLEAALVNRDRVGFTQTLAGGHEILRHYLTAPHLMDQFLLDAAAEARRLGHTSPLPATLLRAISIALWREERGQTSPPADWFDAALAHATRPLRSTLGVQALVPLDNTSPDLDAEAVYELADYLEEHLSQIRASRPVTDAVWDALRRHSSSSDDLRNLARAAVARGRFQHGEALYRAAGTPDALVEHARWLADLPGREHDTERAFRDAAATGHPHGLLAYASRLATQPCLEKETEQTFRNSITAGHPGALPEFADWLAEQPGSEADHRKIIRNVITADTFPALPAFADWIGEQPDLAQEAEQTYRDAIAAGHSEAVVAFARWLARQPDRAQEAEQTFADAIAAGDPEGLPAFAEWLAHQPGRENQTEQTYRNAIATGHKAMLIPFVTWLADQPGRQSEAEELARTTAVADILVDLTFDEPGHADEKEPLFQRIITTRSPFMPLLIGTWLSADDGGAFEKFLRDAIAAGNSDAFLAFMRRLTEQPGREGKIEQTYREALASGDTAVLPAFACWLATQPGRGHEAERTFTDAIAAGHIAVLPRFAGWLSTQPGRENETEQTYLDAIAAGAPLALEAFVDWLSRQPGRESKAKQTARFGLTP